MADSYGVKPIEDVPNEFQILGVTISTDSLLTVTTKDGRIVFNMYGDTFDHCSVDMLELMEWTKCSAAQTLFNFWTIKEA